MKVNAEDIFAVMRNAGIDGKVVDGLKPDLPLLNQGLDSIDLPSIAVAAEKKFAVDLSDADAAKLMTVNDFAAYLNQKLA